MSKDRTSAKTMRSEVTPASQPSGADAPTPIKSRERLRLFAQPRHLKIITAEQGRALIDVAKVAGWKPEVRAIHDEGLYIRFKGLEIVAEA